jgi:hydroxylamine reductase
MAGCDGRQNEREYYSDFAQALPKDTIILTAGCAKFRYNSLELGTIGGITRVVDAGQCNDCYSLMVIAQALAQAFDIGISDLPVSYNIAWYEQKAVLVLLALLSLGVKNITLGPRLPAFISPGVLDVLVKQFDLKPNATVQADLARMVPD